MKTKLWGIWEIRQKRFMSENGIVFIYEKKEDVKAEIKTAGEYQGSEIILIPMPIHLTPYDNKQIFESL